MLSIVTKVVWGEEQREKSLDRVRVALENYVETIYGSEDLFSHM